MWTSWLGLALGLVMVSTTKIGPPPVILDLGPVEPTPAPTPKHEEHKRLITTITVQNGEDGESAISFEATDFADEGKGKTRVIASKNYSISEEKPKLKALRHKIMEQVRDLEHELLQYVQKAGPPKPRAPINPLEQAPSGGRPY